jgi:hypothetical protein
VPKSGIPDTVRGEQVGKDGIEMMMVNETERNDGK